MNHNVDKACWYETEMFFNNLLHIVCIVSKPSSKLYGPWQQIHRVAQIKNSKEHLINWWLHRILFSNLPICFSNPLHTYLPNLF